MTEGLRLKRINVAISSFFLVPAALLGLFYRAPLWLWIVGFIGGFIWANWFEYVYHRWLDHTPGLYWEKKHREHHKDPTDGIAVNLGDSGWTTTGMFVVNVIPTIALALWTGVHFAAPMILAFVAYVLTTEEVHWRVHMGGYVPAIIKRYHLSHHSIGANPTGARTKYNIFLPLFDWIFGTIS